MHRPLRIAAALVLVTALLPTYLASQVNAHHDPLPGCAKDRVTGYITVADDTADETNLHYQVFLPKDEIAGPGPYASVMDYSGYQPGLHIWDGLHRHFLCEGYAVVGLNIRGTGCSGGDFDYFEPRQAEDGREAITELTKQSWSNGRLAMVGKSYPGITQLFVAAQPGPDDPLTPTHDESTEPPKTPEGLVAIVPGHVFGDLYRDVPYPGGIMNVTFAAGWSAGRIYEPFTAPLGDESMRQGGPHPEEPHEWDPSDLEPDPSKVDPDCIRNTADHVANPPQNPFVKALYNHYDGDLFHERSPWYWAQNIDVPTFLVEAWQDEQVGSRATELIERFREGLELRALFTNGDHGEYYGSHVLPHIDRFLRYYLAQEIPAGEQRTIEEEVSQPSPSPSPTATLPNGKPKKSKGPKSKPSPTPTPSPSTRPETYAEALARYEAENPVQINWENGGTPPNDRTPQWIETYPTWPPPNQEVWRLNFTTDGKLTQGSPPAAGEVEYRYQPGSSQQRGGYDIIGEPPASWDERPAEGTFAMFTTDELTSDKLMAGTASVDLFLSSTAPDTDLQVTLTELRPDGQEMFVQQSWLRASHRKEADSALSTPLRPFHTHLVEDTQLLVPTLPAEMRVEIFPFAHAFRAGSRIRLYVEAPHAKPDLWGFAILPVPALNTIHIGENMSSIALPVLAGDAAETPLPPCNLRNQPCRDIAVTDN